MRTLFTGIFLFICLPFTSTGTGLDNLLTEYTRTPVGTDVKTPRFSWQMVASEDERGAYQTAYRIEVADQKGTVVWDTRKVESEISSGIEYAGIPLTPATRYIWTVSVWDQAGGNPSASSWFETGLMDPAPGSPAWSGAQWIGGGADDMILYSHYLSVFKVEYTLQLDQTSGSTRAGFVLGANDNRLLDKNMNIFGIASGRNGHYVKFEIDISPVDSSGKGLAKFNIYRVGYHPGDKPFKPLYSIEIPSGLINSGNKYQPHNVIIESVFGVLKVSIDGSGNTLKVARAEESGRGGININPVGSGGDYISFPMLADIGFSMDAGQKASFSNVVVRNYRKPSNVLFAEDLSIADYKGIYAAYFTGKDQGFSAGEGAYQLDGGDLGLLIVADPGRNSMPMLRTEFNTKEGTVEKARLYVTARGIYEIYLNGKRVGEDYFNPGLTQYNITHLYQTYDVTDMIVAGGDNAMGAMLGEGWWSGNYTYTGDNWNYFGDRQSLLAKLVITYQDGSEKVVTTSDKEWKYFSDGPVIYGSFFQGEVYDARKESLVEGWSTARFDDSSWKKAQVVPLEGTALTETTAGSGGGGTGISYDRLSLTGQIGENAGVIATLKAQSMNEIRPGVFVYDMGQNMVGVPDITIENATEGKQVRLRFAEVLYPDLDEYKGNEGMVMLENLRAAHVQDLIVLKSGTNRITPRFTFHGYRYVEITGIDKALPLEAVQGRVISSVHELSADYQTSNEKVNRFWKNIVWSQYANFLSIPTDCPQRNERMGWSGDISVYSRTATYLANVDQFFRRHMIAMRNSQSDIGRFSDVAPLGGGFGGLLWGSAGMTLPWEAYLQYGDEGILREHYEAMATYMDYLSSTINKETGLSSDATLGDWLGPQNYQTGSDILATAYHIFDLGIMTKTAEILGKTGDAEKWSMLYNERKEFFNTKFVNDEHRTMGITGGGFGQAGPSKLTLADTQTSYAVGLALGAFSDENIPYAARFLAEACSRGNTDDGGVVRPAYSLMTGFIGTAWISKALSDNGYSDIAYKLLQQTSYPSWLYPVDQGATSIWERLNSYTVEAGFGGNNSMNSFNHYSFGAVGQWMMAYSLGIKRDIPGFKKFILQPEPDPTGSMTWAKGYYDSMYGRINSSWKVDDGVVTYEVTIPPNSSATLLLPVPSGKKVRENGKPVKKARGVKFVRYENGKAVYELKPGNYIFSI